MRKFVLSLILIFIISSQAYAKYSSIELKNGLRVFVEENRSLPIVNVTVFYKVGCVDEYNSITGISHMLEHMNFRGSKHFEDGYIDKLTSKYGGVDNAQTSFDYTVYFATIDRDGWRKALAFYADNMNNLQLDKSKFLKERSVVYQERLWRIDNSADGFLYYTLHNLAYFSSPYRWTPIGFAYDIQHYTIEELRNYYKRYYAPNNAIVVISGDVDKNTVFNEVKKDFGFQTPVKIDRHITKEPKQCGRKVAYIKKPSAFKKIAIGFKIPKEATQDTPALDLISYMLFFGKSALAKKDLVRDKHIFASIDGGNEGRLYDSGLFEIFGDIEKEVSFDEARSVIVNELDKIKKGKFDRELIEAAKAKCISDYLFSKETLRKKNIGFAFYAAFGLENYYYDYLGLIKKIDKKTIMDTAEKYFIEKKESDCFLTPEKGRVTESTFRGDLR
jgi:zinc protease